jgi:hypothetical protein
LGWRACAELERRRRRRLALHAQFMVAQHAHMFMVCLCRVAVADSLPHPVRYVQEGKALEDKLGNLKDQLTDLRSAIKSFETEFDQRLDACLQQVSRLTSLFALFPLLVLLSFGTTKGAYGKGRAQLCRARFVSMKGCGPLSASCADVQAAFVRVRCVYIGGCACRTNVCRHSHEHLFLHAQIVNHKATLEENAQ